MQAATFARTKIQPPTFRRGLIGRSRIEARLGAALMALRLVLLVAPAGCGKTAALSRQLQQLPEDCALGWVTVDSHDDVQRLILCLAEALEPCDLPWRTDPGALALLAAQPQGARAAAAEWTHVLGATPVRHGVIVLDDLHGASDPRMFEFLDRLINDLPEHWTLAIASRMEPPLSLGRLRVSRELAAFSQGDLSFDEEEIRLLCTTNGADASDEAVRQLHERTRGWASGLSLSLEAHGAHVTTAQRRRRGEQYLFDYLASEVLAQMPQELSEFLLRCSVLPDLSAARCAVVSGNPRAAELLEEIERRGLFVSVLENEELTLKLHDLFREFLGNRLRRRYPDELAGLLERAAQGESDPMRKVNLLIEAGDWAGAEQVLANVASLMLASGDWAQVIRLVQQFPTDRRESSPQLAYAQGLCAWHRFLDGAAQEAMHRAAAGFDRLGRPAEAQRAQAFEALALMFLGRFEEARQLASEVRTRPMDLDTTVLIELFGYWDTGFHGPAPGPARHLENLVDLLSAAADPDLWYRCASRIFIFVGRTGVNAQLRRFVQGALLVAGDGYALLRAAAEIVNGWLLIWKGEFAQAIQVLQRLQEDSRWLGRPEGLRLALLHVQGVCHAMRHDREGVRAVVQSLPSSAPNAPLPRDLRLRCLVVELHMANLLFDGKAMHEALAAIEAVEGSMKRLHLQPPIVSMAGKCAFANGRLDEAARLLEQVLQISRDVDRQGMDAGTRQLLARIELRRGHVAAAWALLRSVLESAGGPDEICNVIQAGVETLTELAEAPWGALASTDDIAVLRRWAGMALQLRVDASSKQEDKGSGVTLLSAREMEVLCLIADGSSNKAIAKVLDLSPHTVKRHVARILERLDLSSRMQAAAWYRERA